jgi:hypothetical protein
LFYATAFPLGATALGVLAESHMGRPTKIEGNEMHPASLGATDVLAQASVLDLYDPDRSQVITRGDEIVPWQSALAAITEVMKRYEPPNGGAGLRILTQAVGSPTFSAQMRALLKRYPLARWHRWEPLNRDDARRGSDLAFDDFVDARYRLADAEVIVALDADFLAAGPGGVRYARDFAGGRRLEGGSTTMNRLYAGRVHPDDHRCEGRPPAHAGARCHRAIRATPGGGSRFAGRGARSAGKHRQVGGGAGARPPARCAAARSSSRATTRRRSSTPWRIGSTIRSATSARPWTTSSRSRAIPVITPIRSPSS